MPSSAPKLSSNAFKSLPPVITTEGDSEHDEQFESSVLPDTQVSSDPSTGPSSPCATYVAAAATRRTKGQSTPSESSPLTTPAPSGPSVSSSDMLRPGAEVNARKPKAGDYIDVVNALIIRAASEYESFVSTKDAFPDTAKRNKWAKLAWKNAGLAADEQYPLLDSINLLVCHQLLLRMFTWN